MRASHHSEILAKLGGLSGISIVPSLVLVPNHDGKRAVFAQIDSSLRRREAQRTGRVMRPPSNSKHILYEELPIKGQPGEKLALRLGVSMLDRAANLGRLPRNWT
jgi:hypothetical protein